MVSFSSISAHLQVKIAEKMDYFHKKQFQLSSKYGKDVGNRTKHKSVIDVFEIASDMTNEDFHFRRSNGTILKKWKQLREIPNLPLFKVSQLWISEGISLNAINDLIGMAQFVNNKVLMAWGQPIDPIPMFLKLTKVFNIRTMQCNIDRLNLDFFNVPKFCEMERLELRVSFQSPIEKLPLLKSQSIEMDKMSVPQAVDTANIFFKDWARKERTIRWYSTRNTVSFSVRDIQNVFKGLHCTLFYRYKEGQHSKKITYLKEATQAYLYNNDVIYFIDRGDKKLLVAFHSGCGVLDSWSRVIALEYTDLKEDIKIEDCD